MILDANGQPPAQQAQPTFNIGLEISEQGVKLKIPISPITVLEQTIPEDMMNQLCAQWLENRRQLKKQQDLIADVMRTKR